MYDSSQTADYGNLYASDKEDIKEENQSQVAASKAITILIDENNTLYYFKGKPDGGTDIPDEGKLFATTYGKNGLRKVLLESNPQAVKAVQALRTSTLVWRPLMYNRSKSRKHSIRKS